MPLRFVFLLLVGLAAASCRQTREAPGPDRAALADEARAVAGRFGAEMKEALIAALQQGGPEGAIGVCKEQAPAIAARLSSETGWRVGRTSLKFRNPANTPDAWESARLDSMAQRLAAGDDPASLEEHKLAPHEFRYMKAIAVEDACLLCHGAILSPALVRRLDAEYPEDRARGYQPGDLRGAFTIRVPLSP